MYQCIYELWLYDSSNNLLFITLLQRQSLFWNIPLKGHLIQSWWIVISFSSVDSRQCIKNFTLIYHLTFLKGRYMTFQGRCKKSQGRCKTIWGEVPTSPHLPSKSGHAHIHKLLLSFVHIPIYFIFPSILSPSWNAFCSIRTLFLHFTNFCFPFKDWKRQSLTPKQLR